MRKRKGILFGIIIVIVSITLLYLNESKYINIYKIKYQRINDKPLKLSKKLYKQIVDYILEDCKIIEHTIKNNNSKCRLNHWQ